MKKISIILALAMCIFGAAIQSSAQGQYRDIAVVGHNRNTTGTPPNPATIAPNSRFSGWNGGTASFNLLTTNGPRSFLKNKISGAQQTNCTATLDLSNLPAFVDYDTWGSSADLLFNGQGNFAVSCGATVLNGTFKGAILHVSNGSNSAGLTLIGNAITYLPATNLITNQVGNYSFNAGTLSIGITTDSPVTVDPAANFIGGFEGYSNITFGARKL